VITSVQNPRVKAVRKLHEPKWRKREGLFLLEGTALVEEAARSKWPLEAVFATGDWLKRHDLDGMIVEEVSDPVLSALSTLESPEGVVATARLPGDAPLPDVQHGSLWVVADAIQDPGNLGAIIRSADAAGADAILCGPGTADPFGPKAVRASMGSVLHLPIVSVPDLDAAHETARHADPRHGGMRWIALAPRAGKSLYEADLCGPIALWLGNEAAGLSSDALGQADEVVTVPMPGRAESLNAAASAAVVLFEAVRQRMRLRG